MMNISVHFRLLLIALFLLSSQITTIHSKHRHLNTVSECHVCHTAKHLGEGHYQQSVVDFRQNIRIEISQVERKHITRQTYSWNKLPLYRLSDFDRLKVVSVQPIPIGYFATAPPSFS